MGQYAAIYKAGASRRDSSGNAHAMGAVIFIVCFTLMAFYWDFVLRLYRFLFPRKAFGFYNEYTKKMSRQGFALISAYTGLRLDVDSALREELPPTFLLVSNHQSLYDIPALIRAFPERDIKFIAKKELSRFVPFVSVGLKMGKHAVISRKGDPNDTRRELRRLAALARKGCCPHVFPEGTRSRTGAVGRFYTAALRTLIRDTRLPMVSVAIDGGYHISRLLDMTQAGREKRYRVRILGLYPPPADSEEFRATVQNIREEIIAQLQAWRSETGNPRPVRSEEKM